MYFKSRRDSSLKSLCRFELAQAKKLKRFVDEKMFQSLWCFCLEAISSLKTFALSFQKLLTLEFEKRRSGISIERLKVESKISMTAIESSNFKVISKKLQFEIPARSYFKEAF